MSDATAGGDCKRIEGQVKALRSRIRRLAKTKPGPQRQQVRLGIAADLILISSQLQQAAVSILIEPETEKMAGPS